MIVQPSMLDMQTVSLKYGETSLLSNPLMAVWWVKAAKISRAISHAKRNQQVWMTATLKKSKMRNWRMPSAQMVPVPSESSLYSKEVVTCNADGMPHRASLEDHKTYISSMGKKNFMFFMLLSALISVASLSRSKSLGALFT